MSSFPTSTPTSLLTTTTTPTIRGTLTALLALTTPFIPPNPCPTVQELTSFTAIDNYANTTNIIDLLFSNPSAVDYTSCQPPGWASVTEPLRQSFSPAVCPSDWHALSVSTVIPVVTSGSSTTTISTAWCCKPYVQYHPSIMDSSAENPLDQRPFY